MVGVPAKIEAPLQNLLSAVGFAVIHSHCWIYYHLLSPLDTCLLCDMNGHKRGGVHYRRVQCMALCRETKATADTFIVKCYCCRMDNVRCYQPFADKPVSTCLHCRSLQVGFSLSLPVTQQHKVPVASPTICEHVRRADTSSITAALVAAVLLQSAVPAVAFLPTASSSSSLSISTIPLPPLRPNYAYVLVPLRPLFTPPPPPTTRSSPPIVQTTIVPACQ